MDEGYKTLCQAIGVEFCYQDYQFWYFQIYYGERDFNENLSFDSTQPTFLSLPNEILGSIVGKLGANDRTRTRKTSKRVQEIVDRQDVKYTNVSLTFYKKECYATFGDAHLSYKLSEGTCRLLNDVSIMLKPPRVGIDFLWMECSDGDESVAQELAGMLCNVSIKRMVFECNPESFLAIFSRITPKKLISFKVYSFKKDQKIDGGRILKLDQFKKTQKIDITGITTFEPSQLKEFYHLKSFMVPFSSIGTEDIVSLLNIVVFHWRSR